MEEALLRAFVLLAAPSLVGLAVLAGVIGLWRLHRPENRTDGVRAALVVGGLLGLSTGVLVDWMVAELASFDSVATARHFVAAAPFAAAAGGLVFLSSVAGFGLGRLKGPRSALAGSVVAPLLFAASVFGLNALYSQAWLRLHAFDEAAFAADLEARSGVLSAEVVAVEATFDETADPPVVTRLDLRVRLETTEAIRLEAAKVAWPQFTAYSRDSFPLSAEPPPGSPQQLEPVAPAEYAVTFDVPADAQAGSGTFAPPVAGPWKLSVDLVRADGEGLQATAAFAVAAPSRAP